MHIDRLRLLGLGGSNKVMQGELSRLVRRALEPERSRALLEHPPTKVGPGGIAYPFAADLASVAVSYHRTCARVLWDVYASSATRLEPLYEELYADVIGEQRPWLCDGLGISVVAFGTTSVTAGERQVVGVVKNALIEGARARGLELCVAKDKPDLLLHARTTPSAASTDNTSPRVQPSELVVSLDLAGRPMHQRGYRSSSTKAPLREDLAANLVMLARHDARRQAVIDPMAGSGTLLIEAALLGAGRPLWMSGRTPSAAKLKGMSSEVALRRGALFGDTRPLLFGADIDADALTSLNKNAETAGVHPQLTTFAGDFRNWRLASQLKAESEQPGLILSNPPYGARLEMSEHELGHLYRDLGAWCREFSGYTAAFLVGAVEAPGRLPSVALFLQRFGGKPRIRKPMANGPLSAQFLLYDL